VGPRPAGSRDLSRIRPRIKGGGKKLVRGTRPPENAIKGTDFLNLDLLPADFTYRNMDLALNAAKKPTQRLARLLAPLTGDYDIVSFPSAVAAPAGPGLNASTRQYVDMFAAGTVEPANGDALGTAQRCVDRPSCSSPPRRSSPTSRDAPTGRQNARP